MPSESDDISEAARTRETIRRVGALLAFTIATTGTALQAGAVDPLLAFVQIGCGGYLLVTLTVQGLDSLPESDHSTKEETAD